MNFTPVTFGLFADPHCSRLPDTDARHYRNAMQKIRECFRSFREADVDFVVCLGDLIDRSPHPDSGLAELDTLSSFFQAEKLPLHFVLGNHDINALERGVLFQQGGFRPNPYYSFDEGGFHFVVLDSNYSNQGTPFQPGESIWDDTYINPTQAIWLRNDLKENIEKPAVVFVHANLDPFVSDGVINPHVIRNAAEIRIILEEHPQPVTVFQGHYHPGRFQTENGIGYYTLKGLVSLPEGHDCVTARTQADGRLEIQRWR